MVRRKTINAAISALIVVVLGVDPGAALLSSSTVPKVAVERSEIEVSPLGAIADIRLCGLISDDCRIPSLEQPAVAAPDSGETASSPNILVCSEAWDACHASKALLINLAMLAPSDQGRIGIDMPPLGLTVNIPFCSEGADDCRIAKALSFNRSGVGQIEFEMPLVNKAALFGLPKVLKPQFDSIVLDKTMLGPMAHSMFCLKNPEDCQVRKIAFRGGRYAMTRKRWNDLREVNARVNHSIRPERNMLGLAGEEWLIAPRAGDCNDYAVTKRHDLLARGWPSRTLLLAEVVTRSGEHHLVLVVRAGERDVVLDNLTTTIKSWSRAPYQWVRVQSPRNPQWWSTIRSASV